MNDRIKKIEDRCWYQESCDFDMKADGLSTILTKFDRKKFAELIVRDVVEFYRSQIGETSEPHTKTLEHFGVE